MVNLRQASWWAAFESWPLDRLDDFDLACDDFENQFRAGQSVDISQILGRVPAWESPVWMAELLAIEMAVRWQRGESLNLDVFLSRFPTATGTVRRAWNETSPVLSTLVNKPAEPVDLPDILQLLPETLPKGRRLQLGSILDGRYRIIECVGQGGMGELYRAVRTAGNLTVAVKTLKPSERNLNAPAATDWFEQRFQREMEIQQQLRDPHLATALDFIQIAGQPPIIIMDWIDGRSLDQELKLRGPLPWPVACEIIRQAATGLGRAWQDLKLVHRDIKPSNMMLRPGGRVVVIDFGLARAPIVAASDEESIETVAGERFGTPAYAAPEQFTDARSVTATADVYSLGRTLLSLLTNSLPKPIGLAPSVYATVGSPASDPASRTAPQESIPPGLAAMIARMTAPRPTDRPAHGLEVADLLSPWTKNVDLANWYETGSPPELFEPQPETSNFTGPRRINRRSLLIRLASIGAAAAATVGLELARRHFSSNGQPVPEIVEFRTLVYKMSDDQKQSVLKTELGEIGKTLEHAQVGNGIVLQMRFDAPTYVQLIATNPDGGQQLLVGGEADPTALEKFPGPNLELKFPSRGHFVLDPPAGFQSLMLIASHSPLPAFNHWTKTLSPPPSGPVDGPRSRGHLEGHFEDSPIPALVKQFVNATREALGSHATVEEMGFPVHDLPEATAPEEPD